MTIRKLNYTLRKKFSNLEKYLFEYIQKSNLLIKDKIFFY